MPYVLKYLAIPRAQEYIAGLSSLSTQHVSESALRNLFSTPKYIYVHTYTYIYVHMYTYFKYLNAFYHLLYIKYLNLNYNKIIIITHRENKIGYCMLNIYALP